jgi:phosphoribosylformylglycinamidine cyclo-ligase
MNRNKNSSAHGSLTYCSAGVDRSSRERLRNRLGRILEKLSTKYETGNSTRLPFGLVFSPPRNSDIFLDFQIEGVGTKTLLAELEPSGYSTIGIDAVAMVANDLIRSGAKPLFVNDAIHIAKSRKDLVLKIVSGIIKGTNMCGAMLSAGETGDVPEILHDRSKNNSNSEPFDLFVSCCGFGDRRRLIKGGIEEGDEIIGIESSGIHSNGLSLARQVLLRQWGGKYDPYEMPDDLVRPLINELLEPTRIYAKAINEISDSIAIKAAIHITGDGFGKFRRLSDFQSITKGPWKHKKVGFEFGDLGEMKPIFKLIYDSARSGGYRIALKEMYRTFNMGYGFAIIVNRTRLDKALDLFNRYYPSKRIGHVTSTGKIKINGVKKSGRPLIL